VTSRPVIKEYCPSPLAVSDQRFRVDDGDHRSELSAAVAGGVGVAEADQPEAGGVDQTAEAVGAHRQAERAGVAFPGGRLQLTWAALRDLKPERRSPRQRTAATAALPG
jgi:hypothetical protein